MLISKAIVIAMITIKLIVIDVTDGTMLINLVIII